MWSLSGFSGSFTYVTGVSVTRTLGGTIGSLYNNRVNAARLYSNTGLSSTCYASREQNASVTSGYSAAEKVYLSGTTSC